MSAEIAPGVHRIELPLGPRRNSAYLIEGDDGLLLFDTGIAGQLQEHLVPYLAGIARRADEIRYVILSHCDIDHWGGSGDARAIAPAALLAAHPADLGPLEDTEFTIATRYQELVVDHGVGWSEEFRDVLRERANPTSIDLALTGGERLELGGRTLDVLHVPGHTRGHLALWDERTSTLLVADAVLGDTVRDLAGTPNSPPNYRYPAEYLRTCELLAGYSAEWLLTAHYPVMAATEARDFLSISASYCTSVEQALIAALSMRGSGTTLELVGLLQPELGPWEPGTADFGLASMLVGHLEVLESAGRVSRQRDAVGRVLWVSAAGLTER